MSDFAAQLRRFRPGFMTLTVMVAMVVCPTVTVVAAHMPRPRGLSADYGEEVDARVRSELIGQGFAPIGRPAPVELLGATRAFELDLFTGRVCGRPPRTLDEAVSVVTEELARYPASFLAAIRIKRVLFCSDLTEAGVSIPSLPNFEQSLLLDVGSSREFMRRLVHHEVFHFADYADDQQVMSDPAWARLNDHYFVYGSGGRRQRRPSSARFSGTLPGFLSEYSTAALEEDKAEVFSFLMADPRAVAEVAARDAIVRAKVAAVRARVARLDPAMGDGFWRGVR